MRDLYGYTFPSQSGSPPPPSSTPTTIVPTAGSSGGGADPYIYCPPDVIRDLPTDSAKTFVRIPQPKTNVNWDGARSLPPCKLVIVIKAVPSTSPKYSELGYFADF